MQMMFHRQNRRITGKNKLSFRRNFSEMGFIYLGNYDSWHKPYLEKDGYLHPLWVSEEPAVIEKARKSLCVYGSNQDC